MQLVRRGGAYYRVCDPSWTDPSDTSFAKRKGGRWNPAGEFGALYRNKTIEVAIANLHRHIADTFGPVVTVYDLNDDQRPDLQAYDVVESPFVDCVNAAGITALGFPSAYPTGVEHPACQDVSREQYAAGERGIATLSAVLITAEELAVFDLFVGPLTTKGTRQPFTAWFP